MTKSSLAKFFQSIDVLMATLLTGMFLLVFLNVIMRYFFNSSITWSEEMARYLFFWLTFSGAVGAMHDNAHLAMNTVLTRLAPRMQLCVYVLGQALIIVVMVLMAIGSYDLMMLNANARAPATNLPLPLIYATGTIASACIIVIALSNVKKAILVPGAIHALISFSESEEILRAEAVDGEGK